MIFVGVIMIFMKIDWAEWAGALAGALALSVPVIALLAVVVRWIF